MALNFDRSTTRAIHDRAFRPSLPAPGRLLRVQRATLSRPAAMLAVALSMIASQTTLAQEQAAGDQLRISYAPKAIHFTQDDEYVDWNHIVALEWVTPSYRFWGAERSLVGFSVFDNSYGQFSQSAYAGLEWDWTRFAGGDVFLALSVGLVHGYKEPYEDKLPLNSALGVGLTLVPSIGWQRDGLGLAASLVGSAVTLRVSYSFDL
jgi:hypothetical protein